MDVLKNKSYRSYNYRSRYASFPYFYNKSDDKYTYGVTANLNKDTEYVLHSVISGDTFDTLACKYYGRPDLYWIIADFNNYKDSLSTIPPGTIKIPALNGVYFDN